MKKITLVTLMLFMLFGICMKSYAKTIYVGGDTLSGGDCLAGPGNFANYSTVQCLYTVSEIGSPGNITTLAYYMFAHYATVTPTNVKIYMGCTSKSTFTSSTDYVTADNLTLVYDGSPTLGNIPGGQWENFTLTRPFYYDGVQNLVTVLCYTNTGTTYLSGGNSFSYANYYGYINKTSSVLRRYSASSSSYSDITNYSGYSTEDGRPILKLNMEDTTDSIYIDDFTTAPNIATTVPVKMKNDTIISGFQFDLALPTGVILNSVTASKARTSYTYNISQQTQSDGSIRILCLANGSANAKFTGNDGEVLNLSLTATETGDKTITLKNQVLTTSNLMDITPSSQTTIMHVDNTNDLYMRDTLSLSGSQPTLPIYMHNSKEICNLQFDVVTPTGMSVFFGENEDEEEVYWITKGERAKEAHTVAVTKRDANTYRVIMSSTSNATFRDTDKSLPIAYLKLDIPSSQPSGTYDVKLTNIILSSYASGVTSLINVVDTVAKVVVPPAYTISVSPSNTSYGSVGVTGSKYDSTAHTTTYGSSVTMTATTKTGCHFVNWTEGGTVLSTSTTYSLSNIKANHTIVANFAPNTYTVRFYVDGVLYSSSQQTYGSVVTKPANPTKTGYTFSNWSGLTSTTTVPANDVSYNAVFTINKYTVKFIADGVTVYNQKQNYNSTITAPTAPTKSGYSFITWGDVLARVPAHDVTYTAEYALTGDLYEDNAVNIADLTVLVGYILDDNAASLPTRTFKMADIHVDNKINVADYTSLVGIIMNASPSSSRVQSNTSNMDELSLTMNDMHLTAGETGELNLSLNNSENALSAMQFDIVLPQGLTFNETNPVTVASALKHSVSTRMLNDNTLRVMVYSANNKCMKDGSLMSLNVKAEDTAEGEYNVDLKNIICSTAYSEVKELSDVTYTVNIGGSTAVGNLYSKNNLCITTESNTMILTAGQDTDVIVTTVSGNLVRKLKLMSSKSVSLNIPSGIYLVNGMKFLVK